MSTLARSCVLILCPALLGACGAVYPEIKTLLRPPGNQKALQPPPPKEVLFLAFAGATIPEKTRDGREWDAVGGEAPDPFAKLFVNNKEIIRTPVQANTLAPTWSNAKLANYRIASGSSVRVEVWDANAINHHPICVKRLSALHSYAVQGRVEVQCASGARVTLLVEPARARVGLGFFYELRTQDIFVSYVSRESPAGRLGLAKNDQIVAIEGKEVRKMEEGEARSRINARGPLGVRLSVKDGKGRVRDLVIKEGPIYPVVGEPISL